jgi:hypothetical protein
MRPQSIDTHPDAERVQIELLRKASVARRFHLVRSLTKTTRQLTWRSMQEKYPSASEEEIGLHFVALVYGQELADRLRSYLANRR